MSISFPADQQKAAVWNNYHAGHPSRVPVLVYTNPRVVIQNEAWNPDGITFKQTFEDPEIHIRVSLMHQLYRRQVIHKYCDYPTALPERWQADLMIYNVYEAACLGADLAFHDDQVPDTLPWLLGDQKEAVFDLNINHPLEWPFIKRFLAFWDEMKKITKGMTFEGRPVDLAPWCLMGSDGPVTVACNLRGTEFLMDLHEDPDYADRLMNWILDASINRRQAMLQYWGNQVVAGSGFADDSAAMLSPAMYRQRIVPIHRRWYESTFAPEQSRGIHMCGDATHLFKTMHDELGIMSFDTGFPVDHGALRERLGPEVNICGGPGVAPICKGTPDEVYELTTAILQSGVKEGGRFILTEANNLPSNVPEANLEAMYAACLEHGCY